MKALNPSPNTAPAVLPGTKHNYHTGCLRRGRRARRRPLGLYFNSYLQLREIREDNMPVTLRIKGSGKSFSALTLWIQGQFVCVQQLSGGSAPGSGLRSPAPPAPGLWPRPQCEAGRSCVSAPFHVRRWLEKKKQGFRTHDIAEHLAHFNSALFNTIQMSFSVSILNKLVPCSLCCMLCTQEARNYSSVSASTLLTCTS